MGNNQTINVEFLILENNKLEAICIAFARHSEKQPKVLINCDISNFKNLPIVEISSITYDSDSPFANNPFEHSFHVYAKGEHADLPVSSAQIEKSINGGIGFLKTVNTSPILYPIEYEFTKNHTVFKIGDIFTITYIDKSKNKNEEMMYKFEFLHFKSVKDQLLLLQMLIDFFNGETLYIGAVELPGIHQDSNNSEEMQQ